MLPSSGIIVFLRTLWLVSAHEIGESDPRSSPFFGKIFSVRSWLRSQIGSLFSGRNGHSYRTKVQTLVDLYWTLSVYLKHRVKSAVEMEGVLYCKDGDWAESCTALV